MPRYIDYDPCDDCRANGDDYFYDKNGDLMIACYDCPLWEGGDDDAEIH